MRVAVFVVGLLVVTGGTALAQEGDLPPDNVPCVYPRMDQVDARLKGRVTASNGRYDFDYQVENGSLGTQVLDSFAIEVHSSSTTAPVQVFPDGWDELGEVSDAGFYMWYATGGPRGLAPGTMAQGFGFAQSDLPTIVGFRAWGKVQPPSFPEGEAPDSCEGADVLENSVKGKTIGPRAPSATMPPIDFLNYLIALLHDSRHQGWIREDGNHQSLLAKLLAAKRAMEDDLDSTAKLEIGAFVNEVQATACQDFLCSPVPPLTSEAYALLYYSAQYLYNQLPRPGRGGQ